MSRRVRRTRPQVGRRRASSSAGSRTFEGGSRTREGFFAYPSNPKEIGEVVSEAARQVSGLTTWEQNDIAGRFLTDPIFEKIKSTDYLAADITRLNFNVAYEVGYAIGKVRRVFLVKSGAIQGDDDAIQEISSAHVETDRASSHDRDSRCLPFI